MQGGFDEDEDFQWSDDSGLVDNTFRAPRSRRGRGFALFSNDRYSNAYGDYNGGYGPGGGFGPPRCFGPRPDFPPGPMFMRGRGYGPGGPPIRRFPLDDRASRYLMRCGVAVENIKNLPRELLQMIEPEYCSLCSLGFESFSMSRLHYTSKNHLKNQKKWLAQQNEVPYHRSANPREIPLKSRELYCELCDVHITSKTHAESHYAGKPHRAIVEGRKNPKNPALLQRGMGHRLDQLIRREKKHLKPVEEPEVKEEEEKQSVPPELYCDICKTSVTCSEQMTMHLNGKRHLAKEKQHIFKAMTSENVADNKEETTAEEATNEEAAEQDNYDWGNDSGTWDEVNATT